MRERAIVLLAAASLLIFVAAGVAREQPQLQRGENMQRNEPGTGSGRHASIGTPRMITWSLCRTPSTGSALSVYSSAKKPMQSFPTSASQDDIYGDDCNDPEDESSDGSLFSGARFPDLKSADQRLNSHAIPTAATIQAGRHSMF
jgi:hypothetical protein